MSKLLANEKNNSAFRISHSALIMLIKIAYRNVWRNMRRTLFCITAVGTAVFFIAVYSSFRDGMNKNMNDIVQIYDIGQVQLVSQQYEDDIEYMPVQYPLADGKNWQELSAEISEIPKVKAVFPRITTPATLQQSTIKHAILWGINAADETAINFFNAAERSNGIIEGRYPTAGSNECAVGRRFAEKSGLKIGDKIPLKTVSAQFSDKIWSPTITGIFNFDYTRFDEEYIIADFERLQRLLVMGEGTQQLVVFADNEKFSGEIAAQIEKIIGAGNAVNDWRDNYWVAFMESVKPVYAVIFMVFLIVASFLIINTVVMIIHERIKEIGMMGCLGMTRGEIVKVFFFESLFLAGLGAFAGVFFAGIVIYIGSFFPIRIMESYGDAASGMPVGNAIFFQFSFWELLKAWLMGVVVASVFTLVPSLKSAFVEPVEALRR